MAKIMHVQTVLMVEEIEALKAKTGETNTKDALAKAVSHYLIVNTLGTKICGPKTRKRC